jgi:hypothetical protein
MDVLVERLRRLRAGHALYSEGVNDAYLREGVLTLLPAGKPPQRRAVATLIARANESYELFARGRSDIGEPLHPHVCPAAMRVVAMYLGIAQPASMDVAEVANLLHASLWIAIKLRTEWWPLATDMARLHWCLGGSRLEVTRQTLLRAEQRLIEAVDWRLHPPLAVEAAEHLAEATGLPACASSWATASLSLVARDVGLAVVRDPILVGAAAVHLCIDRGEPRPHLRQSLERVLTEAGASLQDLPEAIAALRDAIDRS